LEEWKETNKTTKYIVCIDWLDDK